MAVLLAGDLGPVPDQKARVAGELVLSLRDDLNDKFLGDELPARNTGPVQGVGFIEFTLELLLPAALTGITAAVYLALYIHLFRRNKLTPAHLGFRRPTRRMLHLFWLAPATIIGCAGLQILFLSLLSHQGVDTSAAGSNSGALADIGRVPVLSAVITVLVVAVFTPLWEEVLFRGAFLDGLSGRFRPAAAIALSAALFAAIHMLPLNFVYLFTVGIALALLRHFHQNLWAPVIVHAVNNGLVTLIAISFVQSGG